MHVYARRPCPCMHACTHACVMCTHAHTYIHTLSLKPSAQTLSVPPSFPLSFSLPLPPPPHLPPSYPHTHPPTHPPSPTPSLLRARALSLSSIPQHLQLRKKIQNGNGFQNPKWKWIPIPKMEMDFNTQKTKQQSTCGQKGKQKHLLPGETKNKKTQKTKAPAARSGRRLGRRKGESA